MKKIIYIASLCFASLFVSSCEDYLTLESPDQLTSGSFWRNESMRRQASPLPIHNWSTILTLGNLQK